MLFGFIIMTTTCIGSLLSEFAFDESQQQAIIDLIELSNTKIPSEYNTECSQEKNQKPWIG